MHPADDPLLIRPRKPRPAEIIRATLSSALASLKGSLMALLPIVLVIAFFQLVVLQQPIPNLGEILIGALLVLAGLALFVRGLELALFPIGEELSLIHI